MQTGRPWVRWYERASRSAEAFEAEYGEFGSSAWSSVQDPSAMLP